MRLIDADALNKTLQERIGSPTDDKLYEVNLCIIDAPTLDAIPVEWLENSFKNSMDAQWHYAVRTVQRVWQEEQEAR